MQNLTLLSLLAAFAARMFGLNVYYLRSAGLFGGSIAQKFLRRFDIQGLSHEWLNGDWLLKGMELEAQAARSAYNALVADGKVLKRIEEHFGIDARIRGKFHLALEQQLQSQMADFSMLVNFARYFVDEAGARSVLLYADNSDFTRAGVADLHSQFPNVQPRWASQLSAVFLLSSKASSFLKRLRASAKKRAHSTAEHASAKVDATDIADQYSVVYFPHQGIFFGPLFKKDQFYDPAPNSPLNCQRILHLSLGDQAEEYMKPSYEFYRNAGIPFTDFFSGEKIALTKSIRLFISAAFRSWWTACVACIKVDFAQLLFYFRAVSLLNLYLRSCKKFRSAKLALVGYDVLFPPLLSVALALRNIRTVAVQERFLLPLHPNSKLILDTYLVAGPATRRHIEAHPECYCVNQMIEVGLVRLDLVWDAIRNPAPCTVAKYRPRKSTHYLVLALDYHSAPDATSNRLSFAATWKNNKRFYEHLIRLSIDLPRIFIVIKGKNNDVQTNPEFLTIVRAIQRLPNIAFETDLEAHTPYQMAAVADAGIAMYTSLADDMLAAGKPVLIYDVFGMPRRVYEENGYPVVVKGYQDLRERMVRISRSSEFLSEGGLFQLRSNFYGDSYDGEVKTRISNALTKLVSEEIGCA